MALRLSKMAQQNQLTVTVLIAKRRDSPQVCSYNEPPVIFWNHQSGGGCHSGSLGRKQGRLVGSAKWKFSIKLTRLIQEECHSNIVPNENSCHMLIFPILTIGRAQGYSYEIILTLARNMGNCLVCYTQAHFLSLISCPKFPVNLCVKCCFLSTHLAASLCTQQLPMCPPRLLRKGVLPGSVSLP